MGQDGILRPMLIGLPVVALCRKKPIVNRPQDSILPHKQECRSYTASRCSPKTVRRRSDISPTVA